MSRIATGMAAAAAALAALLSGCHTCEDHEASQTAFELAKFNYENKKYDQAKTLYSRCVEKCSDNEDGWLGLANAAREFGNIQYQTAAELAGQGKLSDSKRLFKEAADNHILSYEIFRKKIKEHPDDMAPHYGLGLFYWQRATSSVPFPFPLDDKERRQKTRDLAIDEFQLILSKAPRAWQAHRYLGLALFAAGRMDEGRLHLKIFHDAQQNLYEKILQWPGSSDEEKRRKDISLTMVNTEIEDIRNVLGEYWVEVKHEYGVLQYKRDRTKDDDARMAKLNTEQLQLENMIKGFHLTNLGPVEQEVRRRCDAYLGAFNGGQVPEIMTFLTFKAGDDAIMQRAVQERVDLGTKFRKPQYRTIVVSGDMASVGLVCEVSSSKGTRPDAELRMQWRLVGGQWKVADLP